MAYKTAMAMIQKGLLPTDAMLTTAGLSKADALALAKKYGYGKSSGGSGGGSSKKSSGNGNDNKTSGGIGWKEVTSNISSALNNYKAAISSISSLQSKVRDIYDPKNDRRK
jgi:hypothetical protein